MKQPIISKIKWERLNKKWYIEINDLQEIEISEKDAENLIKEYGFEEYNLFRWRTPRD